MANSSAKPGLTPEPNAVAALTQVVSGDEGRRGHHVDAGGQDADQLFDVDPHRVVDHAVRFQSEQLVDIVGGSHPQRGNAH